jgi:hypothetical protein
MKHQSHTVELRNWFVDGYYDFDLNPCYVIGHFMGEEETFYGDDVHVVKPFYDRKEAEAFAEHLNEKDVPETYTYSEWRE